MNSESDITENRVQNILPPKISNNPREQVQAENISVNFNGTTYLRLKLDSSESNVSSNETSLRPVPCHPIALAWCPDILYIDVGDNTVTKRLCLLNLCPRSISIHCCGVWNEEARLGAYWRCYPKTRFMLAPGLHAEDFGLGDTVVHIWIEECTDTGGLSYPLTLLAQMNSFKVFVRAEPKYKSPIPCAKLGLQVAAAHKRDHVIAYFVVPLTVRFSNYVTAPSLEHYN